MNSFDIGVLIALEEEFECFNQFFKCTAMINTETNIIVKNNYIFTFNDKNGAIKTGVVNVLCEMGQVDAALETLSLIQKHKPKLLINIGICGSVSEDFRVGDVIIASDIDSFLDKGKVSDNESNHKIHFAGKKYNSKNSIVKLFENIKYIDPRIYATFHTYSEKFLNSIINQNEKDDLIKEKIIWKNQKFGCGQLGSSDLVVISKDFSSLLKGYNRKLAGIDMEAGGVAAGIAKIEENPPYALFVKGVSDPANDKKEFLDGIENGALRNWAMSNATFLLKTFLSNLVFEESLVCFKIKQTAEATSIKYLRSHFFKDEFHRNSSQLLPLVIKSDDLKLDRDLFNESIYDRILDLGPTEILKIEGLAGTGKTTLLECIYHVFLEKYHRGNPDDYRVFPVYIDLSYFLKGNKYGHEADEINKIKIEITKDLSDACNHIDQNKSNILLIIDGVDHFGVFCHHLRPTLASFINNKKPRVVVGKRAYPVHLIKERTKDCWNSTKSIKLGSVEIESQEGKKFITAFGDVSNKPVMADKIIEIALGLQFNTIKASSETARRSLNKAIDDTILRECNIIEGFLNKYSIDDIDLRLAKIIYDNRENSSLINAKNFSEYLKYYCENFLRNKSFSDTALSLNAASELAFNFFINNEDFDYSVLESLEYWRLINRHKYILGFLVAYYIVETIININVLEYNKRKVTIENLNHLYPYFITRFVKEIIDLNYIDQSRLSENIFSTCEVAGFKLKSFLFYILGRLTNKEIRNKTETFLNIQKKKVELEHIETNPEDLIIWRSANLSLIYINEEPYGFLDKIFENSKLDCLNRGFHLEYFGDISFNPKGYMAIEDRLGCFQYTFKNLKKRIFLNIARKKFGLVQIDSFTVFSLFNSRFICGIKVDDSYIKDIFDIYHIINKPGIITHLRLKHFLLAVIERLQNNIDSHASLFELLYNLKENKRSGWEKLFSGQHESISDHSHLACLVAMVFLPETLDNHNYVKSEIINMLLVHDVPEFMDGDIPFGEKNIIHSEREMYLTDYISDFSSDRKFGDTKKWFQVPISNFEKGLGINSKIAKDIDKIENLIQLHIYRERIEDKIKLFEWRELIQSNIHTEIGMSIFNYLDNKFFK